MYSKVWSRLDWFFGYIGEPDDELPFMPDLYGDVNFDGIHNVQDIIIVVNFVLSSSIPTDDEFTAADMNVDCIINILDVVEVVNIILGSNDLARTVEWLEKSFPELETKKRLEKLNIDWRLKND